VRRSSPPHLTSTATRSASPPSSSGCPCRLEASARLHHPPWPRRLSVRSRRPPHARGGRLRAPRVPSGGCVPHLSRPAAGIEAGQLRAWRVRRAFPVQVGFHDAPAVRTLITRGPARRRRRRARPHPRLPHGRSEPVSCDVSLRGGRTVQHRRAGPRPARSHPPSRSPFRCSVARRPVVVPLGPCHGGGARERNRGQRRRSTGGRAPSSHTPARRC
jgi:hypothetical protein